MTHRKTRESQRWRADGVRHQIMLRALPAQRHDVLGALSAARLATATLARRLQQAQPDITAAHQRVLELSQQLAAAVASVAVMRLWDAGARPAQARAQASANASPDPQTGQHALAAVLQACADMLRTATSLAGHQIELLPSGANAPTVHLQFPVPDAHYAVLGWLMHHLDTASGPLRLCITLDADALWLAKQPLQQTGGSGLPPPPSSGHQISAAALDWLLADLGWTQGPTAAGGHALFWPRPVEPAASPAEPSGQDRSL